MVALVGACVLIIIAAAVLLFAMSVLRRQGVKESGEVGVPLNKAMSALPKQEALAGSFNTAHEVSPGNGQLGSFRADHMTQLNRNNALRSQSTKLRWSGQSVHEFSALATRPQPALADSPNSFSTEPLQTEQTPQFSVPEKLQLPSTPLPEQQVIPSTPTGLWEGISVEEMTDPLLEAMMHQAQAGLYIVPRREGELHS
jgi:hypothetical protein